MRWTEFALKLPRKDAAIAGNMKNMNPRLLENNIFEIIVDNAMAEKDMLNIKPQIEQHLRTQLHNEQITMKVRISEQGEILQKKNSSLQKLKDLLGLELS